LTLLALHGILSHSIFIQMSLHPAVILRPSMRIFSSFDTSKGSSAGIFVLRTDRKDFDHLITSYIYPYCINEALTLSVLLLDTELHSALAFAKAGATLALLDFDLDRQLGMKSVC
jgi:hypothetical protein